MSGYKPYTKYKDSGVVWLGKIPDHWQLRRLKYVFKIQKRIAGELGHSVLSITQRGIMKKDIESGAGQLAQDYSKYQFIYPGEFAMNHMDLITGYVDLSDFHGVISPDYRVFILSQEKSDKRYLLKILQHCYHQKIFYSFGQGVSQFGRWRLPAESFNNFIFPIPPSEEQFAMGRFLDYKVEQIDRFIRRKKQLLILLHERILSAIQCNNGHHSLNENPFWPDINPNWKIEKSKRIFYEVSSKGWPEEELLAVTQNRGVLPKSLCAENFVMPTTGIDSQKLVEEGDFVISLRSFQGGIEYSNYRGIVSPAYTIIRLKPQYRNERTILFYKFLFKSKPFISLLNTAISGIRDGKNISWSEFSELLIPVPDSDDLTFLPKMVNDYEKQKAIFSKEEKATSEYKYALIAEVVTGKIDVREYQLAKTLNAEETYEDIEDEISIAAEDEAEYETQENG